MRQLPHFAQNTLQHKSPLIKILTLTLSLARSPDSMCNKLNTTMASSSTPKSKSMITSSASSSSISSPSAFASSTSSFFPRAASSPPRVRMPTQASNMPSSSLRFFLVDRSTFSNHHRSISVSNQINGGRNNTTGSNSNINNHKTVKKSCVCSPSTHPGAFRCSLHKNSRTGQAGSNPNSNNSSGSYGSSRSLNFRRSAMTNSLVRICGVEGDLVKRALSTLIRPSSHQIRRRTDFQPRPSRLSVMS